MSAVVNILNWLYDEEQNVLIGSFWDGGWNVALGDSVNGFSATGDFEDLGDGVRWLLESYLSQRPERREAAAKIARESM